MRPPISRNPAARNSAEYSLSVRSRPSVQTSMLSDCMCVVTGPAAIFQQQLFGDQQSAPVRQRGVDFSEQHRDLLLRPIVQDAADRVEIRGRQRIDEKIARNQRHPVAHELFRDLNHRRKIEQRRLACRDNDRAPLTPDDPSLRPDPRTT